MFTTLARRLRNRSLSPQLGLEFELEARWMPVILTGRTWALIGQDNDGTTYNSTTLVFTAQTPGPSGLALDGYFDWIGSSGISGRELFRGTLTANETALEMQGYDLVNANGILLSHYNATLAATGNSIIDGTWDGPSVVPGTWSATAPALTNTPPTISDIPDPPAVVPGTSIGPLAFTVGDTESPVGALVVTATSSNTALVDPARITLGGAGASRTVSVVPTAGLTGTAVMTVTVADGGGLTAFDKFTVTFAGTPNTPPTISDIADPPAIAPGSTVGPLAFTIGDTETPVGNLTVAAASSNAALVPVNKITFAGTGMSRTVAVAPVAGQTGTATITVTVTDEGGLTATDKFTVTVTATAPAPTVLLAGGSQNGAARPFTASGDRLTAGAFTTLFGSVEANVRTAMADVTGDGVLDLIAGTGPGPVSRVTVRNGATQADLGSWEVFPGFTGGVYVAAGDLTGDGKAEVIVTPDQGGGPLVALYNGALIAAGQSGEAAQFVRFFGIQDKAFRGGARPTLGDVNGDGAADLIVSAGFLGGPRIAIFNGKELVTRAATIATLGGDPDSSFRLVPDFFAFENTLRNGAFVSAGDVTGDGRADLIFGGGPGGAPRVRVFDGKALLAAGAFNSLDEVPSAQRANFFAGDGSLRGGVRLATRDVNADGKADLMTGSGEGEASRVRVFLAANLLTNAAPTADQELDPFGAVLANGVFVG